MRLFINHKMATNIDRPKKEDTAYVDTVLTTHKIITLTDQQLSMFNWKAAKKNKLQDLLISDRANITDSVPRLLHWKPICDKLP